LEVQIHVHMKDVLKCFTMVGGEQCVMMDSLTQQQESHATLSDLGMFKLYDEVRYNCMTSLFGLVLGRPARRRRRTCVGVGGDVSSSGSAPILAAAVAAASKRHHFVHEIVFCQRPTL